MIGKEIRNERIMDRNTGRTVIVPMDHGFTLGQIEGLLDMTKTISEVSEGGAAIVLHKGLVKPCRPSSMTRCSAVSSMASSLSRAIRPAAAA